MWSGSIYLSAAFFIYCIWIRSVIQSPYYFLFHYCDSSLVRNSNIHKQLNYIFGKLYIRMIETKCWQIDYKLSCQTLYAIFLWQCRSHLNFKYSKRLKISLNSFGRTCHHRISSIFHEIKSTAKLHGEARIGEDSVVYQYISFNDHLTYFKCSGVYQCFTLSQTLSQNILPVLLVSFLFSFFVSRPTRFPIFIGHCCFPFVAPTFQFQNSCTTMQCYAVWHKQYFDNMLLIVWFVMVKEFDQPKELVKKSAFQSRTFLDLFLWF